MRRRTLRRALPYETLPSQVRDLVPTDDEIAAAVEATVSELDSHLPVKPDNPD
ncbi:hypothetical protein [Rhodococcus sp. YH3-3]|uniref:hypothetical protein n=1 Tax=Rhodococcus sp. YH3-3 TaxID=1803579 RepID=UPI000A505140|nr:hypothetical protein [Rhodococcus sp. YH3-3]